MTANCELLTWLYAVSSLEFLWFNRWKAFQFVGLFSLSASHGAVFRGFFFLCYKCGVLDGREQK